MIETGTITHWRTDKGYGFIQPETGGDPVFAHISTFMSRVPLPRPNEIVTFTVTTDSLGRKCTEQVMREGERPRPVVPQKESSTPRLRKGRAQRRNVNRIHERTTKVRWILLIVVVLAVVAYGAYKLQQPEESLADEAMPLATPSQDSVHVFKCDGRTQCSQMTSCEEATFFIQYCPRTEMDGDGDGVPCERQWCEN